HRRRDAVEVVVLDSPEGNLLARGSYYGGPNYEFVVAAHGRVFFWVGGDAGMGWGGADAGGFRRVAHARDPYETQGVRVPAEEAQLARVAQLRRELESLGALPEDMPPDPEPLWSLLLFEAENGLG